MQKRGENTVQYVCLVASICAICVAHYIRTKRWQLFVEIYEKPNERVLLQSLSTGFLLNFFLPFKLGDLVRALYAGRYMKNGKTLALTTVIVDRYLDVLIVGLLYLGMALLPGNAALWSTTGFYIALMLGLALVTVAVFLGRTYIKKGLKMVAAIFNPSIELRILKLGWALITNIKDIFQRISKWKMVCSTIGMWILYLVSYYLFAEYLSLCGIETSLIDVFSMFFAKSSIEIGTIGAQGELTVEKLLSTAWMGITLYLAIPIVVLFLLSMATGTQKKRFLPGEEQKYLNLLPQLNDEERRKFLELYFSDNQRELIQNYLKINQNISIIRDYSAGSNATTMLCLDENGTFFRKYAFAADGEKLYEQVLWLQAHQSMLPLPQILRCGHEQEYCYYDMPYQNHAVGLFTYAHSMPVERTWSIIQSALETLEKSVYLQHVRPADQSTIQRYIAGKVDKNLNKIKNGKYIKGLLPYDEIVVNGVAFPNLNHYEPYLTSEHLEEVFKDDIYSDIHGDLTIENIICTQEPGRADGFYIIDPNTGNIHDSPNLDYGKLLQSIHGGYEFLMATKSVSVQENHINFSFTKSQAYAQLHEMLKSYMKSNFTYQRVRSIYYHEIIHWLRLMPYKIERNGERSLLFYAGMLMVMKDVIGMFEGTEHENKTGTV